VSGVPKKMSDQTIILGSNEELVVSQKYKDRIDQPYCYISRAGLHKGKQMGIALTEMYMEFNKAEQWFYKKLWQNLNYKTNQATILQSDLTKSESNALSAAYTSLRAKDLVRRVRKEIYMINPNAVLHPSTQATNIVIWDSLK
jgi:hypothetical protein